MKEYQPSGNVRILVDTLTIYSERLKTALDTEKAFDIVQNKFQKQIMKKKICTKFYFLEANRSARMHY